MNSFYEVFYDLWNTLLAPMPYADLFAEITTILILVGIVWLFIQCATLFRYKTNKTLYKIVLIIVVVWIVKYFYPNGFPILAV